MDNRVRDLMRDYYRGTLDAIFEAASGRGAVDMSTEDYLLSLRTAYRVVMPWRNRLAASYDAQFAGACYRVALATLRRTPPR